MQNIGIIIAFVGLSAVSAASPLLAQTTGQTPHPTCDHCQATYVPKSELDAYFDRGKLNSVIDQQVRHVDLGAMRVGIAMVYRPKGDTHHVVEHEKVSEVYYVLDGGGTLQTGPSLVKPVARRTDQVEDAQLIGPSFDAESIDNEMTTELKAGDVVIIPAGTGHLFTKVPDHITYIVVRLDPGKVLPLKSAEQSKAHLAKPYKKGQDMY